MRLSSGTLFNENLVHFSVTTYRPVGGKLDFLAISLTTETAYNKGIAVKWDSENAASKVTLTVPAENTQNDILYSSAANIKSKKESAALAMEFRHAQAWLEFQLTGTPDGVVTLKGIELENAYNAGTLTVNNNGGTALAHWDFSGQKAQNIPVDNIYDVKVLMSGTKYMDMLIPEQPKTAFVIYYTLGEDDQVLSYRFETDQKTWLMGEKYIYNISINTNEVRVRPTVVEWNSVAETISKVKVCFDHNYVTATLSGTGIQEINEESTSDCNVYSCDIWGGQGSLNATLTDPSAVVIWSDGNTDNPRTIVVSGDETYQALYGYEVSTTTSSADASRCKESTYKIIAGESATVKAVPSKGFKFYKWYSDAALTIPLEPGDDLTIDGDEVTIESVTEPKTYYAKFIPVDAIAGEFSVSADKKIFFSKGNLQAVLDKDYDVYGADASAKPVWQFAKNQYELIAAARQETSMKAGSVLDLFGWSSEQSTNAVWGISTSEENSDYGDATTDTFKDWGTQIGPENTWHTLSALELNYVLNHRSGNKDKVGCATVGGTTGWILLPDFFTDPGTNASAEAIDGKFVPVSQIAETKFEYNIYESGADWDVMESAGAVFIPFANINRKGKSYSNTLTTCRYWANEADEVEADKAIVMLFSRNSYNLWPGSAERYIGYAVRLVAE